MTTKNPNTRIIFLLIIISIGIVPQKTKAQLINPSKTLSKGSLTQSIDSNYVAISNSSNQQKNQNHRGRIQQTENVIQSQTACKYATIEAKFEYEVLKGCTPSSVLFFNQSYDADIAYWNFGNGTYSSEYFPGTISYQNNSQKDTTYLVTLRVENEKKCFDMVQHSVTISPIVKPAFSVSTTEGCAPFSITIYNETINADKSVWLEFGDDSAPFLFTGKDSIIHEFDNQSIDEVKYNLTLTADNGKGCTIDSTIQIRVKPRIKASFVASQKDNCSPMITEFQNTSIGAEIYLWNFGDETNEQVIKNPVHKFENNTNNIKTYQTKLLVNSRFGCSDTFLQDLVVSPSAKVDFTVSPQAGCSPLEVTIQNNSSNAISYLWNFGKNETSYKEMENNALKQFNYTYFIEENTIEKEISLIAQHALGCATEVKQKITGYPEVKAIIDIDTIGCSPFEIKINNQSKQADYCQWDFGDGTTSNQFSPTHTFQIEGTEDLYYEVRMIAYSTNGCSDTTSVRVHVYPQVVAQFEINALSGCSPFSLTIENQSQNAELYNWDFSDGNSFQSNNSEKTIQHTIQNNQKKEKHYSINLIARNEIGCIANSTKTVQVNPQAKAEFRMEHFRNCSPLKVLFYNTSANASSYEWNFDDGSEKSFHFEPTHIFQNQSGLDRTFKVSLMTFSKFGCPDTVTKELLVHSTPKPIFEVKPEFQIWPNNQIEVTNLTEDKGWSYSWNFDTNQHSKINDQHPGLHNYSSPGNYTIELNAQSKKCNASATKEIKILAGEPEAIFTPDTIGCSPLRVQFQNQSKNANHYLWNFGDGETSQEKEPVHTFIAEGTYTVLLSSKNELGSTHQTTKQIVVLPVPKADFSLPSHNDQFLGKQINFSNYSINNDKNYWDFGDGTQSEMTDPFKQYYKQGTFDVKLNIETIEGCKDSITKKEAVIIKSEAYLWTPNAFIPNVTGPSNGNYISGNSNNSIFYAVPLVENLQEYHMQIYNRFGNLIFESRDVNIGWDGYYRGKLCPIDTYVWQVKIRFNDYYKKIEGGSVTLIR